MKRKAKLNAEKSNKYFFVDFGLCLVYSRKVIKLASEEMSVPQPPIFTPSKSAGYSSVNCESRIADGTLLITWQDALETSKAFFSIKYPKASCTAGIRAIFPEKMKNATKVNSKP